MQEAILASHQRAHAGAGNTDMALTTLLDWRATWLSLTLYVLSFGRKYLAVASPPQLRFQQLATGN
jgi:hypothetical protein